MRYFETNLTYFCEHFLKKRRKAHMKGLRGKDFVPAELKLTDLAKGTGMWLISFK